MPVSSARAVSRQWVDQLSSYRTHRNDEHLEALYEDALRYAGLHLENDLSRSSYWSKAPLRRRAAVLLFLVDRGIVERVVRQNRRVYAPVDNAESWVTAQTGLAPYTAATLELVAALRRDLLRRARSSRA